MIKKVSIVLGILVVVLLLLLLIEPTQASQKDIAAEFEYIMPLFYHSESEESFYSFGPDGGTIGTIEIDPNDSNVVFTGTWGNGVYRSPDRGVTWTHISNGLVSGFLFDMGIDPDNSSNLVASTYKKGAYFSRDGGASWHPSTGFPEETVVYSFAYDPSDTDIVYAAVREKTIEGPTLKYPGGVYRSIDGGQTWVKKSSGLPDDYVYAVIVDPNNISILYAGMHKTGVYKSTNGGKTWVSANSNIHYRDVRSLDINPLNGYLYVGLYDGYGVAYSTNGGASWSKIESSVNQRLFVYSLALDPTDYQSLYLTGPDGLYRCQGNPYPSSSSSCSKIAHSGQYVFAVEPDKNSSYVYTGLQNNGVYRSTDGVSTFRASYTGVKANVIPSVLNDPEDPSVFYVSTVGRGLHKSVDGGTSWTILTNGAPDSDVNQLVFRPGNSNVIYAATQSEGILISTNGGVSWSGASSGLNSTSIKGFEEEGYIPENGFDHPAYDWMDPVDREAMRLPTQDTTSKERASFPEMLSIGIDPSNPSRMVAGTSGYGIFKSNDAGSTWTQTGFSTGSVEDFLVDHTQPTYTFFAGVQNYSIEKSTTNRDTWFSSNIGMLTGVDVYGLAVAESGIYYAATDNGVYLTINAAETWAQIGLGGIILTDITIDSAGTIWASSMNGLYRSYDGGQAWHAVADQYLSERFLTITPGYGSHTVYFGMVGGNIYRIDH
jgi:photosystem II stability/assembly factor-like uncharacterized protein